MLYGENGKDNGNYYLGFRVLGTRAMINHDCSIGLR